MLFLDGVYIDSRHGANPCFRWVKAPSSVEITQLTHTIARRVGRYLERQGLLERHTVNIFLTREAVDVSDEDPSNQLLGSSITYRIAVGPQQGRKVFTLQTLPDIGSDNLGTTTIGEVSGSRCMQAWPPRPKSVLSWNGYVAISPDHRYQRNVCQ